MCPLTAENVAGFEVTHQNNQPAPSAEAAQRSVVRAAFLLSDVRSQGLTARPEGYEVDHSIPLCAGGADSPENMQLLTREQHREKTRHDLRWCSKLRQAKKKAQKEREAQRERE